MYDTKFEWDPVKADINWRKHGVRFEVAARVFNDPHALLDPERFVDGELRWQVIGVVDGRSMLTVIHLARDENGAETIRIISARESSPWERRRYENQNG